MKKNVIALAVAAAMAAPLAAQAEVTVSGGLQAEVASVGGDGGMLPTGLYAVDGIEYLTTSTGENGGSFGYLTFSAAEDLGNGLKAIAKWNGVANVGDTNAAGGITGRDAYVGLSGGFGTVLAGTLATPYKSSTVSWDPFLATSLQARGNGGMSDAQNGYASNALAYANKFGPATVVLALVLDEGADQSVPADPTKTNGKHAKALSVNVPVGPVEVAVAYVNANEFSNIANLGLGFTAALVGASNDTLTAAKVGVKYAAGPITVAGQYEALDVDDGAGFAIKPTVTYVTGSYAMGSNTFSASWGNTKWDVSGLDDTKYYAVGMTHAFSKTTSSTIGYRSTDSGNLISATGDKETVFAAGLRVKF